MSKNSRMDINITYNAEFEKEKKLYKCYEITPRTLERSYMMRERDNEKIIGKMTAFS